MGILYIMLPMARSRSTTPEVQEDILDAVNETSAISTRRVSMWVGVTLSTFWRALPEQQLYPCHMQYVQDLSLQDYSVSNVLSVSYNSVVQILTSLPLWTLQMKHSSQDSKVSWSTDRQRRTNCLASMLTSFKSTGLLFVGPFNKIVGVFVSSAWCGNSAKSICWFSDNTQHSRNLGSSSGGN
jgi:hypothetical protein